MVQLEAPEDFPHPTVEELAMTDSSQPRRTAAEIEIDRRKACVQRRAIAIDMAAHIAEEFIIQGGRRPIGWIENAQTLKQRILRLIDMTQAEHNSLVVRYRIKDRHGESK